jgi:hypothetical protein
MRPRKFVYATGLILLLLNPDLFYAQKSVKPLNRIPFRLLPGYKIKISPGSEDGFFGTISSANGLAIAFDFNGYGAAQTDSVPKDQISWQEEQTVGKNRFIFIYTRSDELVISCFGPSPANFRAKIRNPKDITEVLLIVVTVEPTPVYPVDPSLVEVGPMRS